MKVSFFVIGLSGAGAGWSAANPEYKKQGPRLQQAGNYFAWVVHGIKLSVSFFL